MLEDVLAFGKPVMSSARTKDGFIIMTQAVANCEDGRSYTDSYGTVARSLPVFDMAKVGKTDRAGFAQNNVLPRYRGSTPGNDCAKPTRL